MIGEGPRIACAFDIARRPAPYAGLWHGLAWRTAGEARIREMRNWGGTVGMTEVGSLVRCKRMGAGGRETKRRGSVDVRDGMGVCCVVVVAI